MKWLKVLLIPFWLFRFELLGAALASPISFLILFVVHRGNVSKAALWTALVCGSVLVLVCIVKTIAGLHYAARRRARERERWAR